jgi:E-phenylitaconyl-CoA hydratase
VTVDIQVHEKVATIFINRPEKLNAMDTATYQQLSEAWCAVRDDDGIRVAIITGSGDRSFTVGADLNTMASETAGLAEIANTQRIPILNRGIELWKPVVAAVNGYCLGGGLTLLLATDLRVATQDATFGLSEVKRGILPGNGGTQRILEQLPHAIAMEMLLLGNPIDARTAQRWGLINQVVDRDQLMKTAQSYAMRLAELPPLAVAACKELALRSRDLDRSSGLRLEQVMLQMLRSTPDAGKAKAAFLNRSG